MKREVQAFINAVAEDDMQHFTAETTVADFYDKPDQTMAPLAAFIRELGLTNWPKLNSR